MSFTNLLHIAVCLRYHPCLQNLNLYHKYISFSSEAEFLIDIVLSTNDPLTSLNVCGRNIRPRFIDDYLSPPTLFNKDHNRFVLRNLYTSRFMLINSNLSEKNARKVDTPFIVIKVTEECPLSKNDIMSYYVDCNGGTFYNEDCSFCIIVPPNAVSCGDCVEIQATASMVGPYKISDGHTPISSFFWVSASYTFKIPVYLVLSHHAKFKNLKDLNNVYVLQACVRDLELASDGKQVMKKVPKNSYYFDYKIGYCLLSADHFCSICLTKESEHILENFLAMYYTYVIEEEYFGEVIFCQTNSNCIQVHPCVLEIL